METFNSFITTNISYFHLNTLFVLGLALFGGTIGGRLFQKIRFPQVVGYIMIGLAIGRSGLGIIDAKMLQSFEPFNYFALGLIGFMIGGELHKDALARYGRQFTAILLFEGLISFLLVTVLFGTVGSFLTGNPSASWALGLLLGAIASATAPAATTDVLWEYKAKGPLTSTVFGIVALDDVLAIALFAVASSLATHILGIVHDNVFLSFLRPVYEIGGAVLIGGASGWALVRVIHHYQQKERVLVFMLGMILFVLGLSVALHTSMLLAAMVLGAVVVNGAPTMSKQVFGLAKDFTPPIFVLFFVFIGAKLELQLISPVLVLLVFLYLAGRTIGKMSGAWLGAELSGAPAPVKKYLPFCLFSQAGVAVGLSLVAAHFFSEGLGNAIITIITISTFVVQLIGPPCVKYAVIRAGEDGKNITEEDILRATSVSELMDRDYPVLREDTPAKTVLDIFSSSPYTQYPVTNGEGELSGVVNINGIKDSMSFERTDRLLLCNDIKEEFRHSVAAKTSLYEAKNYMDNSYLGFLPVTDEKGRVIGGFDRRMYKKFISAKLLELQGNEA